MKKRLFLFIPLMVSLGLVNLAVLVTAVSSRNEWLYAAFFILLMFTVMVLHQLTSLSKSVNKFYQTMEKQLSPYTNKSLRDFPLPVLV